MFLLFVSFRPHDGVVALIPSFSEMEPTQAQTHQRNRLSGRVTARCKKPPFSTCFTVDKSSLAQFSTFPNFQAEIRGMASRPSIARHRSDAFFGPEGPLCLRFSACSRHLPGQRRGHHRGFHILVVTAIRDLSTSFFPTCGRRTVLKT